MFKILKYFKNKDKLLFFIAVIFILFQVHLDLKVPDFLSSITRLISTRNSSTNDVFLQGFYMISCAFGSFVCVIITEFLIAKVATSLSANLREKIFDKTLGFSLEEINKFSIASLITRTTNDIVQIQNFVSMGLQTLIKTPTIAVWATLKILNKNWHWTVATASSVLFLLITMSTTVILVIPKFKVVQNLTDNLSRIIRENLTGLRVVRSFRAEKYEEKKFYEANSSLTKTNLFIGKVMAIIYPCIVLALSAVNLAIFWIGAHLIDNAQNVEKIILFSDMTIFSTYSMQIIMAFMTLVFVFVFVPRTLVSASRIHYVLETNSKIIDGNFLGLEDFDSGKIEFKNVDFKYPNSKDYVLKNISLKIEKNHTVAFIGATGSGKSTLINLITRFFDVSNGEILIDNVNVKEYKLKVLREMIGVSPQKAVLFSGTIASNISYSSPNSHVSSLERAAEISQSKEFIEKTENKFDSNVSRSGLNFSGGQKQRLTIARAIYKKPKIYIFDDSFSALDYETDRKLRQALKNETNKTTCLIVAQRIGTIKNADKIIVLDKGKIVDQGSHEELLKSCKIYKEIAYSQSFEEEV